MQIKKRKPRQKVEIKVKRKEFALSTPCIDNRKLIALQGNELKKYEL